MFGFEQMFWALLSILRHFKSPLQFSRVMAHSCFDKVKSWFLSKNFKVFPNAAPLSSSQCYLLRSRRIRRREKLFLALKGFGHFMFARNRISPTWEVEKDWIHHFHAVIQAQYFALINLDLKLSSCVKASVSLLLILLNST